MPRLAAYQEQLPTVNLGAGQIHMGREPVLVTTILGSCVAVCLHDSGSGTGAICHGALPHSAYDVGSQPLRFVDEAVFYLIDRYRRLGIKPRTLTVKVFGGAEVLGAESVEGYRSIGRQNLMAALETLSWYRLTPSAQDAGGSAGRRLYFVPSTGEVFVKRLTPTGGTPPGCGIVQ